MGFPVVYFFVFCGNESGGICFTIHHPPSTFIKSLLSALFVVILDIVVDPLAHLGDQWFLGKIYYYPKPGFYFDVPLSNFAGWFLVSFVIVGVNLMLERFFKPSTIHTCPPAVWRDPPSTFFIKYSGPALYFGIFIFNWGITLWIRQWWLAFFDLVWILIPGYLFYRHAGPAKTN
ncbi:MAG: carotenoid biosynthesis protein [Deltaproteobacteria bacterium]|nr:carotenoid biosynthesis protein [Deltaproteobacteria bacterium]